MQTHLFEDHSEKKGQGLLVHRDFIKIRAITEDEISELFYSFQFTPFGEIIVASSKKRIHWIAFANTWREGVVGLNARFPKIKITEAIKVEHQKAAEVFSGEKPEKPITLYPVGTDFQVLVWKQLLNIPKGTTTSYGELATKLKQAIGASRAIGTAVGKNPIAYLIPCHRVVQSSGKTGGYMWGPKRKKEILKNEMGLS